MPEHLSDEELEQALRDGLRRRAEGAPSRLREALPGPSGERSGGRRRTVWLAGAAAAVVAVGVPLALQRGSGWVSTQPPPTPTTASTGPAGPGGGWRSESYAGVELSVPSTWGWGGTPVNPGHGDPDGVCEVRGATAAPDGSVDRNAGMRLPFVGRPILQSDACRLTDRAAVHPDVDAVWFDSPRPVGTSRDAVTLEVGGRRISVFTANAELRNRIVKSVRAVATDRGGCPSAFGSEDPGDPVGTAPALVVCAYARAGGRTTLLFGTRRGAAAANAYEKALSAAPRTARAVPAGAGGRAGPRRTQRRRAGGLGHRRARCLCPDPAERGSAGGADPCRHLPLVRPGGQGLPRRPRPRSARAVGEPRGPVPGSPRLTATATLASRDPDECGHRR